MFFDRIYEHSCKNGQVMEMNKKGKQRSKKTLKGTSEKA